MLVFIVFLIDIPIVGQWPMASQILRRFLTHCDLITGHHSPRIVTAASIVLDKCVSSNCIQTVISSLFPLIDILVLRRVLLLEATSQQQPKASKSGMNYVALGVLGAAAATSSTALAEPEVRCKYPVWCVVPFLASKC